VLDRLTILYGPDLLDRPERCRDLAQRLANHRE